MGEYWENTSFNVNNIVYTNMNGYDHDLKLLKKSITPEYKEYLSN